MSNNIYGATALTGGAEGALDAIDGAALADLDIALVVTASGFYHYSLDADSAAAESSPDVISPDANAGVKRWVLQSFNQKMTNPSQPAFSAYITTTVENVTGDDTGYSMTGAIWTEVADQGNNLSNGTFTAPVDGWYQFNFTAFIEGINSTHEYFDIYIITSNKNIALGRTILSSTIAVFAGLTGSVTAWMDANDTAYCYLVVANGDKVIDISNNQTSFSGALIC